MKLEDRQAYLDIPRGLQVGESLLECEQSRLLGDRSSTLQFFGFGWVSRAPIGARPMNLDEIRILILKEKEILRVAYERIWLGVETIKVQDPLFFGGATFDGLERVVAANRIALHKAKCRLKHLPLLGSGDPAKTL